MGWRHTKQLAQKPFLGWSLPRLHVARRSTFPFNQAARCLTQSRPVRHRTRGLQQRAPTVEDGWARAQRLPSLCTPHVHDPDIPATRYGSEPGHTA
jgi:hypothetical protein